MSSPKSVASEQSSDSRFAHDVSDLLLRKFMATLSYEGLDDEEEKWLSEKLTEEQMEKLERVFDKMIGELIEGFYWELARQGI